MKTILTGELAGNVSLQSGFQIPQRYSTTISPARPPILSQQITTDFQLSQEAWYHLSNQMNEMSETNRLIKKEVKNAYKKLTNIQKQSSKKVPTNVKMTKKTGKKTVKFIDNKSKMLRKITNALKEKITPNP